MSKHCIGNSKNEENFCLAYEVHTMYRATFYVLKNKILVMNNIYLNIMQIINNLNYIVI